MLTFSHLRERVRHYAAGSLDPCSIARADGASNRYYVATRQFQSDEDGFRKVGMSQMAALTLGRSNAPESPPPRGKVLRLLDTLAEWQMRHSLDVISRTQADNATITGVTQPSSAIERSSTSPCDR